MVNCDHRLIFERSMILIEDARCRRRAWRNASSDSHGCLSHLLLRSYHVQSIGYEREPIHKETNVSRGGRSGLGDSPRVRTAAASLQALHRGTCRSRLSALCRETSAVGTSLRALQGHVVAGSKIVEGKATTLNDRGNTSHSRRDRPSPDLFSIRKNRRNHDQYQVRRK